jgi:hypothetical protein
MVAPTSHLAPMKPALALMESVVSEQDSGATVKRINVLRMMHLKNHVVSMKAV